MAHVYTNLSGLSCVVMCDHEYPQRVAFAVINRVLDDFSMAFPRDVWLSTSSVLDYPDLNSILAKYQNPQEADPILKVQKELDDTKAILVFFCLSTSILIIFSMRPWIVCFSAAKSSMI